MADNKKEFNWRQYYAKLEKAKQQLLAINPYIPKNQSGIYVFTRRDEKGFKYCYVGKAKNLLNRLAEHLIKHEQHIDNSLCNRKLATEENPYGWYFDWYICSVAELDAKETEIVIEYAQVKGYQMYNNETGGNLGKTNLGDKLTKGYRKGLEKGYSNAIKEVSELFTKVNYSVEAKKTQKGTVNINSQKAFNKIIDLLRR